MIINDNDNDNDDNDNDNYILCLPPLCFKMVRSVITSVCLCICCIHKCIAVHYCESQISSKLLVELAHDNGKIGCHLGHVRITFA